MSAPLNAKLNSVKWGEFRLGELFDINPTKWYKLKNEEILSNNGTIPLVTNSSTNNGVMGFSNLKANNIGNSISCSDTTLGADTMYYQENDFIGYQHIQHFVPKFDGFNTSIALTIISATKVATSNAGYDYAHKFNRDAMNATVVQLPITPEGKIDFEFIESFVRELEEERVRELSIYFKTVGLDNYILTESEEYSIDALNTLVWKSFKIGNLFERIKTNKLPYKAKNLPQSPINEYIIPCLTSSFMNQGLNYYAPQKGATILKNVISIPSNSDVYRAYYQSNDFTVLSDAYAIRWKNSSQSLLDSQYLFMVACINRVTNLPIYSYKNKLGGWNIVKHKSILLPVDDTGQPNFNLMNNLISAIQKLVIKDVVEYTNRKLAATRLAVGTS